ncbi:Molybdate-binding periplasmic protein precursor [compost metagenome]
MKKVNPSYLILPLALWSLTAAAVTPVSSPAPIKVLAAGSLTGAMTAVAQLYTQQTGQKIDAQFGPAGLLRERIENGEQADIFASANMAHPQALADKGWATQPVVVLRNSLCAKALPDYKLTSENLLERLLDPQVGLGTSTPKADPGGDYAWEMFAKAEKVRPGAQAILEAKAQQLVGGKNNPPVPAGRNAMEYFFAMKKVQISLGYCSSRQTTPDPKFSSVPLLAALAITPNYGLSVITRDDKGVKKSHEAAYRFALFLLSPQAQKLMAQYGFTPVALPAEN